MAAPVQKPCSPLREAFRQRSVWLRAVRWGGTTGVLQAVINQGDVWAHHQANLETLIKTIASPVIGFMLVLLSAVATLAQNDAQQK